MQLDDLITQHFSGAKRLSDNHYLSLCPCHDDHKPSLDISKGEKGIVMSCPVCGADGKRVMEAKGLSVSDLFYEQRNNFKEKPKSVDYIYSDVLKKCRFYIPNKGKREFKKCFCWWHKDGKGNWQKGLPKSSTGRSIAPPLYKQHNIELAKQANSVVYVVEGEKDVDTMTSKIGLYAVCSPHGAGTGKLSNKWRSGYNVLFKGVDVAILPDNDEPGRELAEYVATSLLPFAKSVKILDLSREFDLNSKEDITDVYEREKPRNGQTLAEAMKIHLSALLATTEPYKKAVLSDNKKVEKRAHSLPKLPPFTLEDVCKYKPDDIGTAEFFSKLVGDFMRYVPEEKAFYIYNGIIWERDVVKENLLANRVLMDFVKTVQNLIPPPTDKLTLSTLPSDKQAKEEIYKSYRSYYKNLGKSSGRERIAKDIKSLLHTSRTEFDNQPHLLNCINCTYNLKTGKVQEHSAADMLSKCVNAEYAPDAKNERFEKFIDEICESNAEQKSALQCALGYSLIGATPEECLFLAYGKSTRNGKGTLFDLVLDTLGDYGLQMDFDTIARSGTKDASRATPDLARLVGIRYVLVNEPQKGTCFNEGLTKQLTGSDDITARPLYGSVIQFKPKFTIYITTNNLPKISDDTLFSSDRIRILPFNRHFSETERDTSLKVTLRENNGKSAVLNWLIEGYKIYKAEGLKDTEQSRLILAHYKSENDYFQEFINECLDVGDTFGNIRLSDVMRVYKDWCVTVNIKPLGLQLFKDELKKHGIIISQSHKQFVIPARIKNIA